MPKPNKQRKPTPFIKTSKKGDKTIILSRKQIQIGRGVGFGVEAEVYETQISQHKKKSKAFVAKRTPDYHFIYSVLTKKSQIRKQKIWQILKRAGLPVPEISKLDLRRGSKTYLNIIQSNLRTKHQNLQPSHRQGHLTFPRNLTLLQDKTFISNLAKDFAKIRKLGLSMDYPDIWEFFKKGKSFGRIVLDYGSLYTEKELEKIYSMTLPFFKKRHKRIKRKSNKEISNKKMKQLFTFFIEKKSLFFECFILNQFLSNLGKNEQEFFLEEFFKERNFTKKQKQNFLESYNYITS